ncbi:MAG TPA: hypothetical protein VIV11_37605 [Kofleriaceae bacterium]
MTIKLDNDYDLEVHELAGTDQYWARIVDRQTRRNVGDRLLASGTSKDLVIEELKHDALASLPLQRR